jgi:hypothetical protein
MGFFCRDVMNLIRLISPFQSLRGAGVGECAAVDSQRRDDNYQLSGQIENVLRTIPWPDGFPLSDRLEMVNQALTALFDEERREKAAGDLEELMRRPGGLDAFEEFVRDFKKRKVELRSVVRPQR